MTVFNDDLAAMRRDYRDAGLAESDLAAEPIAQFRTWLDDAAAAGLAEPNALVVATVGDDGRPSMRTVLLKSVDDGGFVFFTNYGSRKAREIAAHSAVSLLFPWHGIGRQVIVSGDACRIGAEESRAYFRTRPRGSQLGAWASPQSSVIASRAALDERLAAIRELYPEGTDVPMPEFWGGLRVEPKAVEFWQGRSDRLHDRLRYRRTVGGWVVERLAP